MNSYPRPSSRHRVQDPARLWLLIAFYLLFCILPMVLTLSH